MINKETIDLIMESTRIEEVIGEFVSLKKRGANHIGCCPFHNEKTPSFYVSPSKGIYKCFGCGKSGNAVGFLMEHEHYTYPEALRYLARKYNIKIEEETLTEEQQVRQNERDSLFHVSEFAQKYFADILNNDEMGRAIGLSYFHQRGMSDEIIKTFGLGYCKEDWNDFTNHARRNGYSDQVLEKTGLTIFKEDGKNYDRFRGRVMFPIYSISGRVMGFSGRILSKEKQAAKYVNSPDSEIYSKSHILYGLFQAKSAISKANKCYLVEGNVDVVSMHQSGVCNTVASCGTSLTNEQIRLIKRYTPNVTILYDGDSAGIKAALRAVNLLFEEGMHVRVVLFPDGEDPDSYAQKYGSAMLQEYLSTHEENFVRFKSRVLLSDVQNDPIRKTEALKEIIQTIALVPDMIERQEYIRETAYILHIQEQVLTKELAKTMAYRVQKSWNEQHPETLQPTPATTSGSTPTGNTPTYPPYTTPPSYDNYPTTSTQTPAINPQQIAEHQERKIVSLLLNYGGRKVSIESNDEDNNTITYETTIAEVIVDEIYNDELTFDNAIYQQIADLFRDAVDSQRPLPDANFFAANSDLLLRNTALSLMMDTYTLSKQWYEKKNIPTPSIETHLREDLDQSILSFKQKKVDQMLAANGYELRECNNEDDLEILMANHQRLTDLRKKICEALNRVVS